MKNIVVEIKFNDEPPTEYDYKHFDAILKNGEMRTFHHHKNNPIPTEEEMIGLTWDELTQLAYEAIQVKKPSCYTPNGDIYPLCKGHDSPTHDCKQCCLYENMTEPWD